MTVEVLGGIFIDGSPSFRKQVNAALDYWLQADSETPVLLSCVTGFSQHNNNFQVYTDQDGRIYIAENVAFWPGATEELQQRILATYIAHEGAHAFLLCSGNKHWNDEKGQPGEELALAYQGKIAKVLEVDQKYIVHPVGELSRELKSKEYKSVDLRWEEEWKPIAALVGLALGAGFISYYRRKHAPSHRHYLQRLL